MNWLITKLILIVRLIVDSVLIAVGVALFLVFRKNFQFCLNAIGRLFYSTRGRSHATMAWMYKFWCPAPHMAIDFKSSPSLFGVKEDSEVKQIAQQVRKEGIVVLEKRLSEGVIDEVVKFALDTVSVPRLTDTEKTQKALEAESDEEKEPDHSIVWEIFDPKKPQAVRYDFNPTDLLHNPTVQKIISDPGLVALAREYLGVKMVLSSVSMWWQTDFIRKPDAEASQFYHFETDQLKGLRFLIYLSDVEPANGPHCFVRGSHEPWKLPKDFTNTRLVSDEVVEQHYASFKLAEVFGARGTTIV